MTASRMVSPAGIEPSTNRLRDVRRRYSHNVRTRMPTALAAYVAWRVEEFDVPVTRG
jgi:hypothetical protein